MSSIQILDIIYLFTLFGEYEHRPHNQKLIDVQYEVSPPQVPHRECANLVTFGVCGCIHGKLDYIRNSTSSEVCMPQSACILLCQIGYT